MPLKLDKLRHRKSATQLVLEHDKLLIAYDCAIDVLEAKIRVSSTPGFYSRMLLKLHTVYEELKDDRDIHQRHADRVARPRTRVATATLNLDAIAAAHVRRVGNMEEN